MYFLARSVLARLRMYGPCLSFQKVRNSSLDKSARLQMQYTNLIITLSCRTDSSAKSVFAETFRAIYSVALSPNGMLATGDTSGVVCLWQVGDGKLLLRWRERSGWIRSLAFSPDGRILACNSTKHTVKLFDVSNGQGLRILPEHSAPVGSVAFNPNGQVVASGSDDQTVKLWNVNTGRSLLLLSKLWERLRIKRNRKRECSTKK